MPPGGNWVTTRKPRRGATIRVMAPTFHSERRMRRISECVRKRRRQSAAQRKAQAERMRAYWAAKRKKQAKG
jgi:hypothetical protein